MGHQCSPWTLCLWVANSKFLHTFVICDRLPKADIFFGIDLQKWYSLSCWDSDWHLFIQREGSFLTYTRNKEDLHNIALVTSTLKILPKHNGMVPIKFRGHNLQDQMAYSFSNKHTKKRNDPNIHIFNGIYNVKGKSTLSVMGSYYNQKISHQNISYQRTMHWTFGTPSWQNTSNTCE